jgi:hypothetical protein
MVLSEVVKEVGMEVTMVQEEVVMVEVMEVALE